jgi:hypothetical protein
VTSFAFYINQVCMGHGVDVCFSSMFCSVARLRYLFGSPQRHEPSDEPKEGGGGSKGAGATGLRQLEAVQTK